MILTARKFSAYGPCIPVGQVVRETPKTVLVRNVNTGSERRYKKDGAETLLHITPCESCTDHPTTQYPNGNTN